MGAKPALCDTSSTVERIVNDLAFYGCVFLAAGIGLSPRCSECRFAPYLSAFHLSLGDFGIRPTAFIRVSS
jgi:hypothetical protein